MWGGGGGVLARVDPFYLMKVAGSEEGGGEVLRHVTWQSLLVRAAVVQRVNHEGQVGPGRHHGAARLHHLEAHVVERLDDGCW